MSAATPTTAGGDRECPSSPLPPPPPPPARDCRWERQAVERRGYPCDPTAVLRLRGSRVVVGGTTPLQIAPRRLPLVHPGGGAAFDSAGDSDRRRHRDDRRRGRRPSPVVTIDNVRMVEFSQQGGAVVGRGEVRAPP